GGGACEVRKPAGVAERRSGRVLADGDTGERRVAVETPVVGPEEDAAISRAVARGEEGAFERLEAVTQTTTQPGDGLGGCGQRRPRAVLPHGEGERPPAAPRGPRGGGGAAQPVVGAAGGV